MRYTVLILMIFVGYSSLYSQRYEMVWSDEFDGSQLDMDTWNIWRGSAYNNELQCYTDNAKNVFVEDGVLNLVAYREQIQCANLMRSFSSARISTDSTSIGWEYGRFEARIQMPAGTGFWPAFWLMPIRVIGWPRGGEIDIMEFRGNQLTETNGAVHYWQEGCEGNSATCQRFNSQTYDTGIDLSASFNTYALEWTPDEFKWFFNGELFFSVDINALAADFEPFTGPFYIILNLAVGGNYLPDPTPDTPFPQAFKVDYVRVYQDLNEPPSISLIDIEPRYDAGEDILINVLANDSDGTVEKVELLLNGEVIQSKQESPFQFVLSGLMEGCYDLSAIAYDNDGGISEESEPQQIVVGNGCELRPFNDVPVRIPGIIEMWKYDYGGQGVAYFETTPTVNQGAANHDVPRAFEGVDLIPVEHPQTDFAIYESIATEWISYTVVAEESVTHNLSLHLSTFSNTSVDIELNGVQVGAFNRIRTEGEITIRTLNALTFEEGLNRIRIVTRVGNASYYYMQIGDSSSVSVDREQNQLPNNITLHNVYPNPFNPTTNVALELPGSEDVTLEVYSMDGRKILDVHSGELSAGIHEFMVNMEGYSSGVYFIRLTSSHISQTRSFTLLR
jgi:beta-glucanase (GH16 family)